MRDIDQNLFDELLGRYTRGPCLHFHKMEKGYSSSNYKLETERGAFLLKVNYRKSKEEIRKELDLIRFLGENNPPAAKPLHGIDKNYVQHVPGLGRLVLFNFVEGEEPIPNETNTAAIGQWMGRLHKLDCPEGLKQESPLPFEDSLALLEKLPFLKHKPTPWKRPFPCLFPRA